MPKKMIYIVTSGSYSDYGINAVFSSRIAAKEYIQSRRLPNEDDYRLEDEDFGRYRVEPFPVDVPLDRQWWSVSMDLPTGDRASAVEYDKRNAPSPEDQIGKVFTLPAYGDRVYPPRFTVYVQNRTVIGAIKAGNEKRTQYIAEHPDL